MLFPYGSRDITKMQAKGPIPEKEEVTFKIGQRVKIKEDPFNQNELFHKEHTGTVVRLFSDETRRHILSVHFDALKKIVEVEKRLCIITDTSIKRQAFKKNRKEAIFFDHGASDSGLRQARDFRVDALGYGAHAAGQGSTSTSLSSQLKGTNLDGLSCEAEERGKGSTSSSFKEKAVQKGNV